jgi:uncharacterized protein (DUF1778 family)
MILAWLCTRRTRQATRPNSFSRRKPVAVRTAPAAPSAQPETSGSRALRSRSACAWTGGGTGVASLSPARPERSAVSAKPARTRRLEIRFTHDEASWIISRARARGLSLTDYVRSAALRGSGTMLLAHRRRLPNDTAITIRQLTGVAAELRRLIALAEATRTIPQDEVRQCLAQVITAICELAA